MKIVLFLIALSFAIATTTLLTKLREANATIVKIEAKHTLSVDQLNDEIRRLNEEAEMLASNERALRDKIADLEAGKGMAEKALSRTEAEASAAAKESAAAADARSRADEETARREAQQAEAAAKAKAESIERARRATRVALLTVQLETAEATLKDWKKKAESEERDYQNSTGVKIAEVDREKRREAVAASIATKEAEILNLKTELAKLNP